MEYSEYNTRYNQSIFDVANSSVGDLESVYKLIVENPGLSVATVPPGLTVFYTPKKIIPPPVSSTAAIVPDPTQKFFSRTNQTIYDVCMQTYGSLDMLYKLIIDSNFSNLRTLPAPGQGFIFNANLIHDEIFYNYLVKQALVINTFTQAPSSFLLQDDGFYLLQDDGFKIII